MMIDLAKKEFNIPIRKKKKFIRTVDRSQEEAKETIVSACDLFGKKTGKLPQ